MDQMRILVTGGAGYLGSVLVGKLLSEGHAVTVVDNLLYGTPSLLHVSTHPNFAFVRGDVRDRGVMAKLVEKADVVIPLAAIVGMSACKNDPVSTTTINFDAIVLLKELASASQWIISPCSNSGYGTMTGELFCTEETPMEPISLYGETKVKAEQALLERENSISLRLATVFGPSPRMRIDLLVNDFTYRAVTDGFLVIYEKDFKRNYIHIEDIADCFVHAINNFEAMKGQPFNAGLNEANLSKAELAEKIKEYVPSLYIHYAEVGTDPDKRNYIVSNDKLKKAGFEAKRSLDLGITQLMNAFRMLPRPNYKNA